MLKNDRLGEMSLEGYHRSLDCLAEALSRLRAQAISQCSNANDLAPLSGNELCALLEALEAWVDFSPRRLKLRVFVQLSYQKNERQKGAPDRKDQPGPAQQNDAIEKSADKEIDLKRESANDGDDVEASETIESSNEEVVDISADEFEILNSFYIDDLERSIAAVKSNAPLTALRSYLSKSEPPRIDVTTKEGGREILNTLKPNLMNIGRWPSPSEHHLALMQQVSVNRATQVMTEGLFSVNGPPGTGKTTMLRDVVADNIVKRAKVLSTFKNAVDAFRPKKEQIQFNSGDSPWISRLHPSLTGFEIVVASSNNGAVENISKDLPLRRELGDEFSAMSYLSAIASRLENTGKNNRSKDDEKPPSSSTDNWGLIAATLGNRKNCNKFVDGVFIGVEQKDARPDSPKTIWQWRKDFFKVPGALRFSDAKRKFKTCLEAFESIQCDLAEIERLWASVGHLTMAEFCRSEQSELDAIQANRESLMARREQLGQDVDRSRKRHENISQEIDDLVVLKPTWWERIFKPSCWRDYRSRLRAATMKRIACSEQLRPLEDMVVQCDLQLEEIVHQVEDAEAGFNLKNQQYLDHKTRVDALKRQYPDLIIPISPGECDVDLASSSAYWSCQALNSRRSELFAAALSMHESWLAETLQTDGGFGGNVFAISNLLSNRRPIDPKAVLPIWQSLFMVVPIISTTFASLSRLFRDVPTEAFGWLFIDEAGQAIPQAAVGALLRTRKALIIGDPLQIEPVFTTSPALTDHVAKATFGDDYSTWSPLAMSVQTIADRVNDFGQWLDVDNRPHWIGSPLRVHRRCNNPMFYISNRIAYNDLMNHGGDPTPHDHPTLGQSCWIDVTGTAEDKHFVRTQGDVVLTVLEAVFNNDQNLSSVFVITPFRLVKLGMVDLLRGFLPESLSRDSKSRTAWKVTYNDWLRKHVGTVHTFQGKEADTVVFVLGADEASKSAADWAASKANLLNVAATRAKRNLFIVGDYDLWAGLRYFRVASEQLPRVSHSEFESIVQYKVASNTIEENEQM